jgi:molecular chaperone IbpA
MAVAGFASNELDVETAKGILKVTGRKGAEAAPRTWLHRGIAARDFELRFQLADHVKVVSANVENGLLDIELEREVPEAEKPRKILINTGESLPLIRGQAA